MPTATSLFRFVEAGTFMGDCDIGEMFLNFMLDHVIRPHAGVDFTAIFKDLVEMADGANQEVIWERILMGIWERMMMGFAPSPYMVTKDLLEVECLIRGDRHER